MKAVKTNKKKKRVRKNIEFVVWQLKLGKNTLLLKNNNTLIDFDNSPWKRLNFSFPLGMSHSEMRQTLSDVLTRPALWKIIIPSGVLNEMESYLKEQIDSEASNLIAKTWDQTAIPELTTDGEDVVFPQSPQVLKKVQTANNQTKRIQIKAEKEKKHIKIKDVGDLRKYLKVRKRTRTQFIQDVKKRNIWMKKRYKFLRRGKDSYNCYLQIGKDLTKMTFGKWETNKPLSPEWVKEIIYSK